MLYVQLRTWRGAPKVTCTCLQNKSLCGVSRGGQTNLRMVHSWTLKRLLWSEGATTHKNNDAANVHQMGKFTRHHNLKLSSNARINSFLRRDKKARYGKERIRNWTWTESGLEFCKEDGWSFNQHKQLREKKMVLPSEDHVCLQAHRCDGLLQEKKVVLFPPLLSYLGSYWFSKKKKSGR